MENQDFYQEALKAFDAPIPEPKKEEPEQETAAEVTEPAASEKPKRKFNPWWAAALCAILCLALVIGFGHGFGNTSRGENYIFGIAMEYGDGYAAVVTLNGKWYVELEGLKAPAGTPGDLASDPPTQPIWVFYDGEPEETNQNGCTKKITATFWKTDPWLFVSQDEIEFDLDGDGRKEVWSVSFTRLLLADSFAYRVSLTAKDAQGNTLHAVYFESTEAMSVAFRDFGGKLSLVLYCDGIYEELDIRLEHGKLAIYRGKEPVTLYEPIVLPGDQPPITQPVQTTPSVPPQKTYTIQFELANRQTTGSFSAQIRNLTENEAVGLKNMLDALVWTDGVDEIYNTMCRFTLTVGNQAYTYTFSHDGLMRFGGKYTRIGTAMLQRLLELMNYDQPAEDVYFACLENGDMARLRFEAEGTASIIISDYASTNSRRYAGRYATFGSYYLLALGEDLRQILVLRRGDVSLHHVDAMSHQDMFQATKVVGFHPQDQAGEFLLSIRDADGKFSINKTPLILTAYGAWNLQLSMDTYDWQPAEGVLDINEVLCVFDLFDGTGNDVTDSASYALLTGGRLYNLETETVAAFEEEGKWRFLTEYLCKQSQNCDEAYFGTNQDGKTVVLSLRNDGRYSMEIRDTDGAVLSDNGSYVYMGNSLVLLDWDDGPTYVHLDVQYDTLVYDDARSTPGEVFSQTEELTMIKLRMENWQGTMRFDWTGTHGEVIGSYEEEAVLTEEVAAEISLLLHTMQWEQLHGEPEGIPMGSFSFPNCNIDIYSGMRLVYNFAYEAKLTESQWKTVCNLLSCCGTVDNNAYYAKADEFTYSLLLTEYPQFLLSIGKQEYHESVLGTYAILSEKVIVCYCNNGDVFALRLEDEGWRLLPGHNGIEIFTVPNDTIFASKPIVDVLPEEN